MSWERFCAHRDLENYREWPKRLLNEKMTTDQRVISLLPSATEIVAALGFARNLVGRSHECDFPPGVEQLPSCSSTRVSARASSYDIDRQVKQIVADGLSVYDVDVERLRELRPSLILTQTQCAVCAVTPRDLEHALHTWIGAKPVLLSLEPNNLDDVVSDIRRVGEALDDSQRAAHLIASFKDAWMRFAKKPRRSKAVRALLSLSGLDR